MDTRTLKDLFRGASWLGACTVFTLVVALIAPQQVALLAWAINKLTLAVWIGYIADRAIFWYARPDRITPELMANGATADVAQIRRAIIIAACVIGIGLGQ